MPVNPASTGAASFIASRTAAYAAANKMFPESQRQSQEYSNFINTYQNDPQALIAAGYITPAEFQSIQTASVPEAAMYTDPNNPTVYLNPDNGQRTVTSPGITLDQSSYAQSDSQEAQVIADLNRRKEIEARDPNRFYADRAAIDDLTAQDAQFQAPGTIATVAQGRNYFDPTGQALSGAQDALSYAGGYLNAAGQNKDQMAAGSLLAGAADGSAPSVAAQMALQSGDEQQRAWAQQQLAADAATRRGSNDIRSSQLSQAAGARGNLGGLARLQAANNTALGQAQLYQSSLDDTARRAIEINAARTASDNQAGLLRAQEMATARGQYTDYAGTLRNQALQQAGQATTNAGQAGQLAQQQYSVDQAVLQNAQNNAQLTNQGNQFAAQGNYTAAAANADRQLAAGQSNQAQDWNVAQANQQAAVQAQGLDDTAYGNTSSSLTDAANLQQSANIKLEQDYLGAAQQNAALNNNFQTGNATLVQQQAQFEAERGDKIVGSAIGAGAAVLGAAVASDERLKDIKKRVAPYDFSNAEDDVYSYKSEHQGKFPGADNQEHIGPMAQDLPADVQYDVNGKRVVDTGRLAMRLASSLGAAQRDIRQLKQARG